MNCDKVRKTVSIVLGRGLGAFDGVSEHLAQCRECTDYAREMSVIRGELRNLPTQVLPDHLVTQLQVLASRERMRRISRGTLRALMHFWAAELRFLFDNLMRPFALPFAGGLLSALFLFTMLAPGLPTRRQTSNDVLLSGIFGQSQASFDTLPPFAFSEDDVVVLVSLDRDGAVLDYSTIPTNVNAKLRNDIANMILFTKFQPATEFGMPVASKVLVSFRRDRINVKG
jgi:DNA-binding FrmR family transcriptional regulator